MTDTATPRRRRVPHGTPGTPATQPDEPEPLVAPETAPDKTPHPAPRPKDAPRTMRELREARTTERRRREKQTTNPLREGLRLERVPDPCVLVLFGATGDLAHRKVVPALYQLWRTNLLPARVRRPVHRPPAVRRRPAPGRVPGIARKVLPGPAARRVGVAVAGVADPLRAPGLLRRGGLRPPRRAPRGDRQGARAPTATTSTTSRRSRRRSPRSWPSSGGSGSTTSATREAGGGSSSRSRSAMTSTRRSG